MQNTKNFFILNNYYRIIFKSLLGYNVFIDKKANPVPYDYLNKFQNIEIERVDFNNEEYETWVNEFFPQWRTQFVHIRHKKLIEFFSTYIMLIPQANDVFMDAAGGIKSYLPKINCKKKYMQDIRISLNLRQQLGNLIEYIECDGGKIPLPDESIDKISCHHSFEHFQKDSDTLFIKEAQRLLKQDGKCCILPIFLSDQYVEVTDSLSFSMKFDDRSKRVIDPTATIPGGSRCGNYARIYDLKAFQKRVLNNIDFSRFKVTMSELSIDGDVLIDLTLKCHKKITAINRPYRAMTLERTK